MNYPEYIKVGEKKYKINTDFRMAIKCDEVARDTSIDDYERGFAVIYILLGNEALIDSINDVEVHNKLLELILKYFACGKEIDKKNNKKPDMNFTQDIDLIEASFMYDYNIDLQNTQMHYWKFINLMNGLSNSEFGNCCILSNIRNIRNRDPKEIKDSKARNELIELQKQWALKDQSKKQYTQEEENNINNFLKKAGIRKE